MNEFMVLAAFATIFAALPTSATDVDNTFDAAHQRCQETKFHGCLTPASGPRLLRDIIKEFRKNERVVLEMNILDKSALDKKVPVGKYIRMM